ncbi:hypothetical protein C0584_00135 [Candidatus Parcubacteria bacterium]|nr:MAG: hypothetical protein C0584_00135 [Candidatus Parcubacteria bacterium]
MSIESKYSYKKIKEKVFKLAKNACFNPANEYTDTAWEHHVIPVTNFALKLGKKLGGDLEVLELAALLHDYSAMLDIKNAKDHHIHSARMATDILNSEGYDKKKIKKVEKAILSHRGSVNVLKDDLESKILASADAMSHISELADMFYLTYGVHKHKTEEGAEWLLAKLERSWSKIMPEGKDEIIEDYKIAKKILEKAIV